jgi:zinc/manganese transport system substrate-binding protein
VGANGNVHEYEPTPMDAKNISDADIIFINGLGLEGWIERLIKLSGYKGQVVVVTQGITPLERNGHYDPHAWQSLANAKAYVTNIRDALVKGDKPHASEYQKNAAAYLQKIDETDKWTRSEIAKIPPDKRKVVSTHDAFQYFSVRYGVTFVALLGISTESQPLASDMAAMINQLRRQNIRAVFLENMTDSRLMKQLETDAGAHIGGILYSDALSGPNESAPDYLTMFRHNVTELTAAMRGNISK